MHFKTDPTLLIVFQNQRITWFIESQSRKSQLALWFQGMTRSMSVIMTKRHIAGRLEF